MKTTHLPGALLLIVGTVGVGCGDGGGDLGLSTPSTATQAVAQIINVNPSTQTINEGGAASVTFAQVCVNNATETVTLEVDFADPNVANDVETATVVAPPGGFLQGACAPQFDACSGGCAPLSHVYPDNLPTVTAVARAFQADAVGTVVSQNVQITINNVAPDASLVRNLGAGNVEGRLQNHTGTVADPGLLATEIASVTWTFAAAANVADPTTVTCTCQPVVECRDQANAVIVAAAEPLCGNNTNNTLDRIFLQGPAAYTTTLTILDKDGGTDTATLNLNTINEPPQAVAMRATNLNALAPITLNAAAVSSDSANPTAISEGFSYRYLGSFTEAGIDSLTLDWDLNLGVAGGESIGAATITKASHPNFATLSGETPTFIHNDDDDADPVDTVDRTLRLLVSDSDGGSNQATRFVRIVDVNPIIGSFTSTTSSINEGQTVTFTAVVSSGARDDNATDPINGNGFTWTVDGRNITTLGAVANAYEIVSGCGSASTDDGVNFTAVCTIRFLDDDAPAGEPSWVVSATARDEDSSTTTSTITVNVANVLPTITAFGLVTDTINEAESAVAATTATDPAGALDGNYTLTVTFGGAPTNTVVTDTPAGGSLTFPTLSNLYPDNDACSVSTTQGTCTVTAVVCEDGGLLCSLTDSDTLRVNNLAPTASIDDPTNLEIIDEGAQFDLDGSMADAAGVLDLDYAVSWLVEGNTTLRTVTDFAQRNTQMDATAVYQEDGNGQVITLTVVDEDTGSVQVTRTVNVRDNEPVIVGTPVVALGNSADEPTGSASVEVTFRAQTDSDRISSVVVNWGDGTEERYTGAGISNQGATNSTVTLLKGAGTSIGARPAVGGYDDGVRTAGALVPYQVVVTVNDEDSDTAAAPVPANVLNVAPTIVAIDPNPSPNPVVIAEGTAAAFVVTATDVSATDRSAGLIAEINWGDGSPPELFTGTLLANNNTIFRAAHVFTNIGAFDVEFVSIDKDGTRSGTETIAVEVVNLAPILTDLFTTLPVTEGVEMSALALVDNRGLDPLVYNFIFDCGATVGNPASIEAEYVGIPENLGQASGVAKNTYSNEGTSVVCVRVCDDDGADNSCVFGAADVEVFNQPAEISVTTSAPFINEGGSVTLTASATDLGGDSIDYAFDCNDDGSIDQLRLNVGIAATATATCTYTDDGRFTARVFADDGVDVAERTVSIAVNNVAPSFSSTAATTAAQGAASTLTIAGATDPAGTNDTLTVQYDIDGDGAFDLFSNAANGSATFRFARLGNNAFSARVCDEDGGCSAPRAGTAVVTNVAPVIQNVSAPAQVGIASPVAVSVVATDVGNDTLSYTYAFTGVGPAQTVGPQASSVASASFRGTGTVTVTITVADGNGGTDTETVSFVVIEGANENPTITVFAPPAAINEGGSAVLSATATDNGGDRLTFAFDCQDDGVADTTTPNVTTGTATATCAYPRSGSFVARVTVTDADGGFATLTTLVRVNNVAPVLGTLAANTVFEGQATTLTVVGSTDVGGDAIRIEYDTNGDGAFDLISDLANGSAQVRFADGNSTVRARACDVETACSAAQNLTVLVRNAAPVIQQISAPSSAIVGAPVSVNVTAADAGNDALLYTFDFFNGDTLIQSIGPQASSFATAAFSDSGNYTVEVSVTDTANAPESAATSTGTASFVVTELNTNLVGVATPATIDEGGITTIAVTPLNGVGPFEARFDVNADGDLNDTFLNAGGDTVSENTPVTCVLNNQCDRTVRYPQNRAGDLAFRVLVTVTDTGNNDVVTTAIVAVEVKNVAPTLDAGGDVSVQELATFTRDLAGEQTDPGVQDDHTFSLVSGPAGLTVSDDGLVSFTPSYEEEGVHDVIIRVTDSDGATGQDTFTLTVTIIDANNNDVSDTQECELLGRDEFGVCRLLAADAGTTDSDSDGVSDLEEVLAGSDPVVSDAPRAPVLISPTNGIDVNTGRPTLAVANASNPRGRTLTYTFCIEATPADRCIDDVAEGDTTTSVVFNEGAELSEGATFSWYAFASDDAVDGAESERGTFTVDGVNAAPGAPDALSPADAATFTEGSFPSLEARAVADPDGDDVSYTFTVATDAAFTAGVFNSAARDVPFFTIDRALVPGTYHWRATASDGVASTNGAARTFVIAAIEVNEAPTAPSIVSPSNVTVEDTSATLTITAGSDPDGDALSYEFELADNAAFANAETSGLQAALTFPVSDLSEDSAYFWRARSFDGALYSDWVNATFVVDAENGAPTGLALLSPTDGALLLAVPAAFTATEAVDPEGDALTYQVVVSANADFSSPLVDAAATVVDGVVRLDAPTELEVEPGKTYFWRVTASDGANEIVASASFSIFEEGEDVAVGGGGCNCNATENNDAAGVIAAALGLLALRRRRRR